MENENNVIDIAEFKKGMEVPRGKKYRFKVGRDNYISEKEELSGKEILEKAGKTPYSQHKLFQNFQGGESKLIEYDQIVSFIEPGIEKFRTIPTDPTDGRV